jgi:hypothetical protein
MRPGLTPRRWIHAIAKIAATVTIVWGEKLSTNVPGTIAIVKNGVVFAAAGTKRPR